MLLACPGEITAVETAEGYTVLCSVPWEVQASWLPSLTVDQAVQIASALVALWALAFVFRQLRGVA